MPLSPGRRPQAPAPETDRFRARASSGSSQFRARTELGIIQNFKRQKTHRLKKIIISCKMYLPPIKLTCTIKMSWSREGDKNARPWLSGSWQAEGTQHCAPSPDCFQGRPDHGLVTPPGSLPDCSAAVTSASRSLSFKAYLFPKQKGLRLESESDRSKQELRSKQRKYKALKTNKRNKRLVGE